MARSFDSASSRYLTATTAAVTSYPFTLTCWGMSSATTNQCYMTVLDKDTGLRHCSIRSSTSRLVGAYSRNDATERASGTVAFPALDTWFHVAGVFASDASRVVYVNGTAGTEGTATAATNSYDSTTIGRASTTAYLDGQVADAAIYNVALTAAEIAMLSSGYSPLMVRPEALVAYWPLHGRLGDSGDEQDVVGGIHLTSYNTPGLADHPRIIYPKRQIWVPKAAAAGGVPTLSNLSARLITSSSAQPQIDYTF